MKILLLWFVMISSLGHAQRDINPGTYQTHIRPILSGILGDFYQMVNLFPEFPKELISVINQVDELHVQKNLILQKCPRTLGLKCLENINRLREYLLGIQEKSLELITHQKMTTNLHLNPISGIRAIYQFQTELDELKGVLDNSSLIIRAGASQRKPTHLIIKKVDELSTFISLTVVEYVPFVYREDFRHFYFNFVHPIQQQMSKPLGHDFLNRNINSLNFALNLLNQNLTKRNKKTPEGMAPYLSTIHNRWNSILRYYF
jgi:hypothetical protein